MARALNDRLGDIKQAILDIDRFIASLSYDDFVNNRMAYRACLSALAEIGEAVKACHRTSGNNTPMSLGKP